MTSVSFAELRKNLAVYLDRASEGRDAILVSRRGKAPVVMVAASEMAGWAETVRLLSNPRNARRLLESIADADAGKFVKHDLGR
ncbi:hypothetical protein IP88_09160 [alpha proteobacterium AAP81b]|nr:hypothetical protein IP88_09160 [alpha proteobacterium AAP81b]